MYIFAAPAKIFLLILVFSQGLDLVFFYTVSGQNSLKIETDDLILRRNDTRLIFCYF